MQHIKIVIERNNDGYVGYPLGFTRGAIVGQGDTYGEALQDTESAIEFFIEHYGEAYFFLHCKK
ncbi:MAG: type II toxin-antitoxin system HicB family antitoxin [Ignavibacteriae bacterium]|nr:type II toxin-antitoxin system HicB family antitoxin [Ignavibacteriota bacterium]